MSIFAKKNNEALKKAGIKTIYQQLDELREVSEKLPCGVDDRYVIFSDLHMGDGGSKDDFASNAALFQYVLSKYYLQKDFSLILNGDIEELQRFEGHVIKKQWKNVYRIFNAFHDLNNLYKIIGNHDLALCLPGKYKVNYKLHHSITLSHEKGDMMVFHGHQASMKYKKLNKLVGYTLKYIANPLQIRNYSVSHNSRKQFALEKRVYHYSAYRKLVSVIGHTHRPLFESLSKAERLSHRIENLCRQYAQLQDISLLPDVKNQINSHKKELMKIYKKDKKALIHHHLYHSLYHIPCLFNSGCVIGKRGITCLELENNQISLVHWFDKKTSSKYLHKRGYEPEQLEGTNYFRMVLNREDIDYIFSRINLLA